MCHLGCIWSNRSALPTFLVFLEAQSAHIPVLAYNTALTHFYPIYKNVRQVLNPAVVAGQSLWVR